MEDHKEPIDLLERSMNQTKRSNDLTGKVMQQVEQSMKQTDKVTEIAKEALLLVESYKKENNILVQTVYELLSVLEYPTDNTERQITEIKARKLIAFPYPNDSETKLCEETLDRELFTVYVHDQKDLSPTKQVDGLHWHNGEGQLTEGLRPGWYLQDKRSRFIGPCLRQSDAEDVKKLTIKSNLLNKKVF